MIIPEKVREVYTVAFEASLKSNKNNNGKHFHRNYSGLGMCHLIDNLTITLLFLLSTKGMGAYIGQSNIPHVRKQLVSGFLPL